MDFPFEIIEKKISDSIDLLYFDVENLEDVSSYLDGQIVQIYSGVLSESTIEDVKKSFKILFETKLKNIKWVYGAVGEFFAHLLLNHKGFKQNFLFQNLEERSIKKGFDGLYSIDDVLWLMESKSGEGNAINKHVEKVKDASRDLKNKVDGSARFRNPWRNAYHHASHMDVGTEKTVRAQIKNLMNQYNDEKYHEISEFNIIPCATLFYAEEIEKHDLDELCNELRVFFLSFPHNRVKVVCVSNAALKSFLAYLDLGEENEQ